MLLNYLGSFLGLSFVEYLLDKQIIDRFVMYFLFKREMTDDAHLRLMLFEMTAVLFVAIYMLFYQYHLPLISILNILITMDVNQHLWRNAFWRVWNEFKEFENFKPRQLFVQTIPTSPMPDLGLKNGNNMMQPQMPVQMQAVQQNKVPTISRSARMVHKVISPVYKVLSKINKLKSHPPGLANKSQKHLCSLNVVLQSLASTPMLADNLIRETPRIKTTGDVANFVMELGGLLGDMRKMYQPTLSSQALLEVANKLRPGHPQTDCVEWLMWMIDVIHGSFLPPGSTELDQSMIRYKLLCAVPMAQPLLMQYEYHQVPRALNKMRLECIDKVEHAHALKPTTYSDPIQRLSEVEWLIHKLHNPSVIDDMFTGQIVETQHCLECHHISSATQPFKVLPLSIPTTQRWQSYGMKTLEECLEHFTRMEPLVGSNGLQCQKCERSKPCRSRRLDSGVGDSPLFQRPSLLSPIRPCPESPSNNVRALTPPQYKMSQFADQSPYLGYFASSPVFSRPQACSSPLASVSTLQDGERQALFSQLPDILLIQLLRLSYQEGHPVKVTANVKFPLILDLSRQTLECRLGGDHKSSNNNSYKYSLYAIVVHLGESSVLHGHYVTYAQVNTGKWYSFDDDQVTPVNNIQYEIQTRNIRENTCLLCYRKLK